MQKTRWPAQLKICKVSSNQVTANV
jgi:hypothetical protein